MALNTLDIKHSKKRFLRQAKRGIISEEVLNNGASQWRRNIADTTMDYGDTEPPNLYNHHVLTMAKQEHVNRTLGVEGNNPIMSIVTLKNIRDQYIILDVIRFMFFTGYQHKNLFISQQVVKISG